MIFIKPPTAVGTPVNLSMLAKEQLFFLSSQFFYLVHALEGVPSRRWRAQLYLGHDHTALTISRCAFLIMVAALLPSLIGDTASRAAPWPPPPPDEGSMEAEELGRLPLLSLRSCRLAEAELGEGL